MGFDAVDFQPAWSFSRIVGQARDQDYRHTCGSHLNGAKNWESCELEISPGETMQREEEL